MLDSARYRATHTYYSASEAPDLRRATARHQLETRREIEEWLATRPSLAELAAAFPREWETVERELAVVVAQSSNDDEALRRYLAGLAEATPRPGARIREQDLLSARVRRHMAAAAVRDAQLRAVSGVARGRVRFNLVNGWIAQKLLFRRGLERKPVSLPLFRLIWPLLWQRRLLMPLVQPKGIYCFYSRRLVRGLVELVADRKALEIGAGDGTLARFLTDSGVRLEAVDDYSWSRDIDYPEIVQRMSAKDALARYRPRVVICSWPPPGNDFERHVFKTPSVELYVVIASHDRHAAGNWREYERQKAFDMEESERLSRSVLPPELDPAVMLFQRRLARRPGGA